MAREVSGAGENGRAAVSQSTGDAALLRRLQAEVDACRATGLFQLPAWELIPKWRTLLEREPTKLFRKDGTIDAAALRQFRRRQLFVSDVPVWNPRRLSLWNLVGGGRRGDRRLLGECLEIIRGSPAESLLRKYPCPVAGEPHTLGREGYRYTYRWLKHIWSLGLMKRVLGARLGTEFVCLDIGSSYGIFSGLVKHEWPRSHHILVDFPEQLLLAHYFLSSWLPGCRVAGMDEVLQQDTLTRAWCEQYDFILVPCSRYQALPEGLADVATNFASFGEMTRKWFRFYVESKPFTTARYIFLINRLKSAPTYDTDLTILDYPLWDSSRCLHFGVAQMFSAVHGYRRRYLFFWERYAPNVYFEYIGDQQVADSRLAEHAAGCSTHPEPDGPQRSSKLASGKG